MPERSLLRRPPGEIKAGRCKLLINIFIAAFTDLNQRHFHQWKREVSQDKLYFITTDCSMNLYTKVVLLSSFVHRFTDGDLFADQ